MPYTPTEWGSKNPKLTPELMNHLENGIAELESSTNASVTELENSIAELESSTNASVSELTEKNTQQNDKITALNSKLSKQLGSHTVKSDVPENAVFTDTVYDDTEVKGSIDELNSNLDGLGYGENGGKNILADIGKFVTQDSNVCKLSGDSLIYTKVSNSVRNTSTYNISIKSGIYTFSIIDIENKFSKMNINLFGNSTEMTKSGNVFSSTKEISSDGNYPIYIYADSTVADGTSGRINIQLEEGTTATQYEPYIPSVKMLADENAQQSNEIMDIKMLGWSVPSECPIQNYVDSDGIFHQRVGRVDLGSLNFIYSASDGWFQVSFKTKYRDTAYCNKYITNDCRQKKDKTISNPGAYIVVIDSSYTDATVFKSAMQGVYLYYGLTEEKTIKADGNEVVTSINESLETLGKCKNLLNPTLQTTTVKGVTCTSNGDGTYTLNGTSTHADEWEFKVGIAAVEKGKRYKIIGFKNPSIGAHLKADTSNMHEDTKPIYNASSNIENVYIKFGNNVTFNNEIIKPMITPNLNATYDDFVPYTGDGDTLTSDVAEINSNLVALRKKYGDNEINVGRKLNSVTGLHSTAEGRETTASGKESHAEGRFAKASGECSHAEGNSTSATQSASHAEGCATTASGDYSHAEGYGPTASGYCSHAEGNVTTASGDYSHAEGRETTASVDCSHAEGRGTIASGWEQHVQGKYNEADTSGKYAHIIGGGTDDSNRKNIHTVDWEGNAEYAGNITSTDSSGNKTSLNDLITGIDLKNTSGHVTKVHVDFLNVGGQKIVLQGSVSGAAGDFFSVSKNDNVGFDLKVDNTFVVPEPVTKLLYSSQGDFRSTVVGTITITHGTWSDGTKSISVNIIFNNNYNFTSAAVRSGIVYFDF